MIAQPLHPLLAAACRAGLLDEAAAQEAQSDVQVRRADPLRAAALRGRLPPEAILQALAAESRLEFLPAAALAWRSDLIERLPPALCRRRALLPIAEDSRGILCAVAEIETASDERLRETLQRAFGREVRFALAPGDDLRRLLARLEPTAPPAKEGDADAVAFLDDLICAAFARRASDIHLEAEETGYRIRLRIDGELHVHRQEVPTALAAAVISRLKVLAQMDIAVTRQPQDGSFAYLVPGTDRRLDIRLATAPTRQGERATLRLLGAEPRPFTLDELGFAAATASRLRHCLARPEGMLLIAGPTGSGKTTTLYAALRELNDPRKNILTVEDPVEVMLPGASQVEVDASNKMTFAAALRALLRHDPDILMIGEIRDRETAEIAMRAAMTGHLVLSTLHANSAAAAAWRLLEMGCEPYTAAVTLNAVLAQRLVRRLCRFCRRPSAATAESRRLLPSLAPGATLYEPGGCLRCLHTGFAGRIALAELLCLDERAAEAIAKRAGEAALRAAAPPYPLLAEDAAEKVAQGITSVAEVKRAIWLEE
ncbi:MAG: GspE/PulE family protein [Planctomycetota bacterium]|nr:GspE/PulE family protein [Planctomycetota bacterium]